MYECTRHGIKFPVARGNKAAIMSQWIASIMSIGVPWAPNPISIRHDIEKTPGPDRRLKLTVDRGIPQLTIHDTHAHMSPSILEEESDSRRLIPCLQQLVRLIRLHSPRYEAQQTSLVSHRLGVHPVPLKHFQASHLCPTMLSSLTLSNTVLLQT